VLTFAALKVLIYCCKISSEALKVCIGVKVCKKPSESVEKPQIHKIYNYLLNFIALLAIFTGFYAFLWTFAPVNS
jgi:hypothetical protein